MIWASVSPMATGSGHASIKGPKRWCILPTGPAVTAVVHGPETRSPTRPSGSSSHDEPPTYLLEPDLSRGVTWKDRHARPSHGRLRPGHRTSHPCADLQPSTEEVGDKRSSATARRR